MTKLFLLITSLLFVSVLKAQESDMTNVTTHQFEIPVLKGKATNEVIQIVIETAEELQAEAFDIELLGSDIQNDIKSVDVFYTENKPFLREGKHFGTSAKVGPKVRIEGLQNMEAGSNVFWVSVQLNKKAELKNTLNAKLLSVQISGKEFQAEEVSKVSALNLGIALRKHKDEGIDTYRIPGLATTNKGTLIAVYDIRKNNATDLQEDVDVGMNRSTDGGKTWEPMKVIMDMGEWGGKPHIENGIGDPSVLVDRKTNTIWVAAVWAHGHPGERNWWASKPGLEPQETSQFVLVKSEDDGMTWSAPINITNQIKDKKWYLLLQGPGKGITMQDGTLVFPAQFKDQNQVPHSTIIWSKDQGKSWNIGSGAKPETTEAQVVELKDGGLMLNMRDNRNRNEKGKTNGRAISVTYDLGKTWVTHPSSNGALIEPTCMASLIKEKFLVDGEMKDLLLFSNPNSKYRRSQMTIKASFDDGKTWPAEHQLLLDEKGGRGYSCMTKIDDENIGILYEGSQADLTFQIIPIENIIKKNQVFNYLFESGTEGYKSFRIPAIVACNSGKLLAFAEGRVNGSSDTGDIDLVMKSSTDGGKSWSPLQVIWSDGANVCGNPAPVVDVQTGTIHLLMTWNNGYDHEQEIIAGKSTDTRRVFVSRSENEGETWTDPKEITTTTKMKNWTWYATGPCHGIQLARGEYKGRLIVPCDHIEARTKKYFSHVIFSDDGGKNWQLGGTTPQDQVNECAVAELANGELLLNMRNYDRNSRARKISKSKDGGLTWSDLMADTALVEPICQASLLAGSTGETLYFANPSDTRLRRNMCLQYSQNDGKSWELIETLYSGASAYSDLTFVKKKTIACFYEAGLFSPYEGIVYKTVEINRIKP